MGSDDRGKRIAEALPAFTPELKRLVEASARPELASQVDELRLVARCTCGDAFCAHFYTAPPPVGSYGADHENVVVDADQGMVVLDVVRNAIVAVEVLDRPDVRVQLDQEIPIAGGGR